MDNDGESPGLKKDVKRTSRACLNCRARKSACHLPSVDGVVTTPCERCKATNLNCVIGSSNRGGRRIRKRTADQAGLTSGGRKPISSHDAANNGNANDEEASSRQADITGSSGQWDDTAYSTPFSNIGEMAASGNSLPSPAAVPLDPALQGSSNTQPTSPVDSTSHPAEHALPVDPSQITFNDLQNTSDALGILAQIASTNGSTHPYIHSATTTAAHSQFTAPLDYALIRNGHLSYQQLVHFLKRYKTNYHPYFPLVPASTLNPQNLARTVREEPHLLTAVLVISTRDVVSQPDLFSACSAHMQGLVSRLVAGGPASVEAVEALLVLAEWTPYTSSSDAGTVGRGEEDREAWMHVGTALRIGYYLGLDRYAFTRGDDLKDPHWRRKRLVWTACYISDRQISIRLGRAFWSRGPGPLTTLRKEDFPMLAPQDEDDDDHDDAAGNRPKRKGEDFASLFQATLELTMLFSNVHDVLYSNPGNVSMRGHLVGGYIKYIDDFRAAIYGWKSVWGSLTCAPTLKAALLMSYDYLRLYTNAFAFHATVKRALPLQQSNTTTPLRPPFSRQHHHPSTRPLPPNSRVFFNNIGAVGDARFIYEGLDAAKSLLSMLNTFVDPERALRFMPLRFYLYAIYSGVFLYRARCVGVLAADEESAVRVMIKETVLRLERAGIGEKHPGRRYGQLLRLLWEKVERSDPSAAAPATTTSDVYRPGAHPGPGDHDGAPALDPNLPSATVLSPRLHPSMLPPPPPPPSSAALPEIIGDFSWTDLDAIGNFAVNGGPVPSNSNLSATTNASTLPNTFATTDPSATPGRVGDPASPKAPGPVNGAAPDRATTQAFSDKALDHWWSAGFLPADAGLFTLGDVGLGGANLDWDLGV